MAHVDMIVVEQASEHMKVRQWALGVIATLYAPGGAGAIAAGDEFERAKNELVTGDQ